MASYAAIYIAIEKGPFKIRSANLIEALNEVTATILAYHVMGFGGYVELPWINYHILGISYMVTLTFCITFQTAFVLWTGLKEMKRTLW